MAITHFSQNSAISSEMDCDVSDNTDTALASDGLTTHLGLRVNVVGDGDLLLLLTLHPALA